MESSAATRAAGERPQVWAGGRWPQAALVVLAMLGVACESAEERIARIEADVAALEERVARGEAAQRLLDQVEVVDAGFEGRVSGRAGTARFTVTLRNGTPHLLERIQFEAVLTSPGGSTELLRGKVDGRVPGTVEQGETASYLLYPMEGSSWDQLQPPPGAILELTPIRLSSIGNRDLAVAPPPKRHAADRAALASLREELAELGPSRR